MKKLHSRNTAQYNNVIILYTSIYLCLLTRKII